jgi:hypothetical protein
MDENTETSLKLLTRAIKIQNIELLKKISREIDVPEEELLEKFLKPNYSPRVIPSKPAEERQKYMIR